MEKEGLGIGKYFSQLKVSELPDGREPKYKIGDLVRIRFLSDESPTTSYVLKDGIGLVAEVLFYECKDYGIDDYDERSSYYIIEYKLLPTNNEEGYRYVSEEHLELVESKND